MKPVVIAGAVAAGMSAASELKRRMPEQPVMVFGKEEYISYGACGMPYMLAGEVSGPERLLVLKPADAREKRGIDLRTEHEVLSIDRRGKRVRVKNLSDGSEFMQEYEKLLIATGARPTMPTIPGIALPGIFPMKQYQDGLDIRDYLDTRKPRRVVIFGGGYIGMESAEAFTHLGLEVTVVQARPRILRHMDEDFSDMLTQELERNGVRVLTDRKIVTFHGNNGVERAELDDGMILEADMALISVGVIPNSELAGEAGLELGEKKSILVDSLLRTSDPDIYAAGDCAASYDRVLKNYRYIPLALGANRMGRMCGENIAADLTGGKPSEFPGILGTAISRVFEMEFAKTGIGSVDIAHYGLSGIECAAVKAKNLAGYYNGTTPMHLKLYYEKATGIVRGGQILGGRPSAKRIDTIAAAVAAEMTLEDVYNLDLAYAPPFSPVWDPLLLAARVGMKQ